MGKYTKVIQGLPDLPAEEDKPGYQAQIQAIKQDIRKTTTHTPESLAQEYEKIRFGEFGAVRDEEFKETIRTMFGKKGLKDLLTEVQKRLTAVEQMLQESCDNDEPGWGLYGAGPTTVRLASGEALDVRYEPVGKVEDKDAFRKWCIENGLEESLQLWPTTMNAITKKKLLNGEEVPAGVKAFVQKKIFFRGHNGRGSDEE